MFCLETVSIFVGCDDHHLYCLSYISGHFVWKYDFGGIVKSSCLVLPLTGSTDNSSVICASYESNQVARFVKLHGVEVCIKILMQA